MQNWYRAQAVGTLTATPEAEREENKYFEATSTEGVELPDGSEATLSRMELVSEGGTQGPYWEGKFDRDGYTYVLTIISEAPAKGDVEQDLSSMVPVRGSEGGATTGERAQPTTLSMIPTEPTTSAGPSQRR